MNQGAVHEALNFAAVYDLPLVLVVENNLYSEMTPISAMVRVERLADRASAYGLPGVTIDGNDAAVVHESVAEAVERARSGGGPTIIEAMTERIVGHYSADAQQYRPEGEVEAARTREPLVRLRAAAGPEGSADLNRIDAEVKATIDAAVEAAMRQPRPDPGAVTEHVYVD